MVRVDFVLMVQVLTNLLDNAIKYAPPDQPICVSAGQADDMLRVEVTDKGPGIPDADLERVFDKFYRIQRQGAPSGTGLGLSICRGIVEAHGGRIWAASGPEGGTMITLTLPLEGG